MTPEWGGKCQTRRGGAQNPLFGRGTLCGFSPLFFPPPPIGKASSKDSCAESQVHQAIPFAITSEFCRKRPFARNFRNENEIFAIQFAKPFAFASEFLRNATFAAFCLRFGAENSLANCRGASEFAFAALSLRPRCTQPLGAPEVPALFLRLQAIAAPYRSFGLHV